ncbi:UTRA domain-containing protein [Acidisphaera sp. L21]|uniref:UTRA domain-containing protein n=1 Tax=Acidisphaera sp. L21 TaxID=1641851 RepID=UPI00131A9E18|nr:UTRA domain-containing protein [Acidisphaera sp. L21]
MNAPLEPPIAPLSLTGRIHRDIQQRIVSGDWPAGTRIPFETELAGQYRCSRMTVNKALSALVQEGLITRRRKAGSFVAEPKVEQAVMEIQDFAMEAARLNLPYHHEILAHSLKRLGVAAARAAGLPHGARVLHVMCRHSIGERPVAFEDRLIALAAVPAAADEQFDLIPPGTWLLRRVPWSQAEHTIRACCADASLARVLDVKPGEACLVLHRRTWHLGKPVTTVDITYAGERQHLVGRFSP